MKNYIYILIIFIALISINPLKEIFSGVSIYLYSLNLFFLWSSLIVLFKSNKSKQLVLMSSVISFFFIYAYSKSISSNVNIDFVIFVTSSLAFLCVISCLLMSLEKPYSIVKFPMLLIYIFISIISIFLVGYYKTSGVINTDGVYAILQSNIGESISFVVDNINVGYLIFLILSFITFVFFVTIIFKVRSHTVDSKVKILLIIVFSLFMSMSYNKETLKDIRVIKSYYDMYHKELSLFESAREKFSVASFDATSSSEPELHVVVIGEALARYNMSSYGYASETTPWISSSDGIVYTQAYSNHTHTMPSLSLALTSSNQYNSKKYYESPSIIQIANEAGFNTAWFSNQLKMGKHDNVVSIISDSADYQKFITHGTIGRTSKRKHLDKDMLPEIRKYLSMVNESESTVIFVHMMGSHGSYCDRTKGQQVKLEKQEPFVYVNKQDYCYDRSVKYTDEFLSELYDMVRDKSNFKTLTFFSDHGEDVFNKLGHNSAKFTEYMSEIPLIIWGSDGLDSDIKKVLDSNKDEVFTNDLIFDYLIGVMNIDTDLYKESNSIASSLFGIDKPKTLHGKINISELPSQLTKANVANNEKVMAHRVNTVGALIDAKKQEFNRIEFDALYDGKNIVLGHDNNTLVGITLKDYLEYENQSFEQIWIDFKNLNDNNFASVFNELNELDEKFDIKRRALFETSFRGDKLKELSLSGWNTSYYLPTKKLVDYQSIDGIADFNRQLIAQIKSQHLSSLSFNYRVYDYIVNSLTIDAVKELDIELNTWLSLNTSDKDFQIKFDSIPITSDPLVNNVIVQYPTRFKK
ncbi:phosphoethanolamine transferase [Vibrio sp. SCSIO 43135]|uniref:phosphoethanolamine transferase n=1 Tax=Vibrio sp. SCSIO 43135 TaxID=2819096 RepID=UPI0020754B14|nr:phosphoethanolamine transferase [Vibrio sp. SCSIO 43135]USD40422.1 phosphoethanolamine transferase [Vibrio sp. SCSIO 43135]